jgi:hypothetical protein
MRVLAQDAELRVQELPGRIYVLHVFKHLSRAVMAAGLRVIWSSPGWRQPWGLVVTIDEQATYDGDIRKHEMPPDDKRAVGTAVVTSRQGYRMVIKSIGIGFAMVSRFALSAHETLEEGIEAQRAAVARAEAKGRTY